MTKWEIFSSLNTAKIGFFDPFYLLCILLLQTAMPDMVEVAYIDTQIGSSTGYIRCHSCEDAKILLDKSCGESYQLKLVTGQY